MRFPERTVRGNLWELSFKISQLLNALKKKSFYFSNIVLEECVLESVIINLRMVWAVLCGSILCLLLIPITAQCPQAEKLIKAAVMLLHQKLDFFLLKCRHTYTPLEVLLGLITLSTFQVSST